MNNNEFSDIKEKFSHCSEKSVDEKIDIMRQLSADIEEFKKSFVKKSKQELDKLSDIEKQKYAEYKKYIDNFIKERQHIIYRFENLEVVKKELELLNFSKKTKLEFCSLRLEQQSIYIKNQKEFIRLKNKEKILRNQKQVANLKIESKRKKNKLHDMRTHGLILFAVEIAPELAVEQNQPFVESVFYKKNFADYDKECLNIILQEYSYKFKI